MSRPNEPVQPEPLAYFITWTTYGTWLPGDHRGWASETMGIQPAAFELRREARARMQESPCILDAEQRSVVERTIVEHCRIRAWRLFAVNCRTNHVHVVVAANVRPDIVRGQFKTWATRRLKELEIHRRSNQPIRRRWWSEDGSDRFINNERGLEAAIAYVREAQDRPRGD